MAERVVYSLKIERESLLRQANAYARALNKIDRYRDECSTKLEARHAVHDVHGRRYRDKAERQAAAYQRAMAKLNADYPLGAARDQLRAINVEIAKAVAALHRFRVDHLKEGEHFCSFKINSGGVNAELETIEWSTTVCREGRHSHNHHFRRDGPGPSCGKLV